jgi:transposase-like protein
MGGSQMAKKRRTFSPEFKFQVVLEVLTGAKRPSEACREHQISDSVLNRWRQKFLEEGPDIFKQASHAKPEEARIAELERLIGQLTLKLAAVKKASDWLDSLP